jgi:hypothetical protein
VSDAFETWDGAYVLGTLSAAEREAFEEHLLTCDDCVARVRELEPMPALLRQLTETDVRAVSQPDPLPDTLLPRLLKAADARRRRVGALVTGLAAAVAACTVALAVLLWPGGSRPQPAAEVMHPVLAGVPLQATVRLVPERWGTDVETHCTYAESGAERRVPYVLVVYSRSGSEQRVGGWTLGPGDSETFHNSTSLRVDDIGKVVVALPNERPVLELDRT